jgi:2-polyprenyl-3-methyl-5-hydroxy-6-metoxy-1,4-benzoquinol methylase
MSDPVTAQFVERKHCIACGSGRLVTLSSGRFDSGPLQQFIANDPWGEHPAPFLVGKPWALVACEDCGQAFHRYILDEQWNERRFSRWMSHEAIQAFEKDFVTPAWRMQVGSRNTSHVLQLERLTRQLRSGSNAVRLLDFGCGYGDFLAMCSLYGFETCGVDRAAARRGNNRVPNVVESIDEARSQAPFHVVTLFEVLEHLDDPGAVLSQLSQLLAHGGILVLETPDCTDVQDIVSRQDYLCVHPLEHINAFTPETLRKFAERFGFEHIKKPMSMVTSDADQLIKSTGRFVLMPLLKQTTQLYFRKG